MNIAILLSTYNGSVYLKQQLDSLFRQNYNDFEVFVRDDGSSDATLRILKAYDVKVLPDSHNVGAMRSFESLLSFAVMYSTAKYFMFCDQDDVWYENKAEKTLLKVQTMEEKYGDVPLLVHTDLEVVDETLNTIAPSMWKYEYTLPEKNSFNRLLVQNTVTGCTVIINRTLANKCLKMPNGAIMHDWWMALVASQFGKVGYIEETTIKYRQHSKNSIGAKGYKGSTWRHILSLIKGLMIRDQSYIKGMQINFDQARAFLDMFQEELDERSKALLVDFTTLGERSFLRQRIVIYKYQLLKQGLLRNLVLLLRI